MSGEDYLQQFQELLIWIVMYFLIFAFSWMPIWRNSEMLRKFAPTDKKLRVEQYGWQTRKRKQTGAAFVLMHPRIFYEGVIWAILYILAALASYHAIGLSGQTGGTLLIVAAELTLVHGVIFGTWTITPFYWDLPLWGCIHLTVAWVLSVTLAVLYGFLHLEALWFYLPFVIAQTLMTGGNWVAWIVAGAGTNRATRIGNPLKDFFVYGLQPKSYSIRDVF